MPHNAISPSAFPLLRNMKGTAAVSLSNLSKVSPNKRKPAQSSDTRGGSIKPRAAFEQGDPNWPCPSPGCPGHIKIVKKKEGGQFGSCDHRVYGDDDSCDVTTTLLQPSTDHPKFCLVCISPVGGTPTLGEPTQEKDQRGYTGEPFVFVLALFFFFSRNLKRTSERGHTAESFVDHFQTSFFWRFVEHLGLSFERFTVQAVRRVFPRLLPCLTDKCAAAVIFFICSLYLYRSLAPLLLLLLLSCSL